MTSVTPLGAFQRDMYRIWEREASDLRDGLLSVPLRFRVVPGLWPEIALHSPEWTPSDVSAEAHEILIRFDPGDDGTLTIEIGETSVRFEGRRVLQEEQEWICGGVGPIDAVLYLDERAGALVLDGAPALTFPIAKEDQAVVPVTENVGTFRVAAAAPASVLLRASGTAAVYSAHVFGLAPIRSDLYERVAAAVDPGALFYQAHTFSVMDGAIFDAADRGSPALVPDRQTIVAPIRVVEEFVWRPTGRGDMVRVADRAELWCSRVEPYRYPRLHSEFRTLDATFELAAETFQRNTDGEFSLPSQKGVWSAGFFQGPGQGFGSWLRDSCHVAIRGGSLFDPAGARSSLLHAAKAGFDNGSDGDALLAVAVWDHFLATGDGTLSDAIWPELLQSTSRLDDRFDSDVDLIHAPQSTSNDLFEEIEVGGFALSTEILAARSYEAMGELAERLNRDPERSAGWRLRAEAMKASISERYWNAERGYFTSGPRGTSAFEQGLWESSGTEAALWSELNVGRDGGSRSTLRALRTIAMSDYGIVLFPNRVADDHFTHSVWYCWQAGFARAAARTGDAELVHQLIGQQIRSAIRNKTFYEVTDARTGESWRWPGQLWHAAGFVSLVLFGALGLTYDSSGMKFTPALVAELADLRLDGLRYRQAILDIEVRGFGRWFNLAVDGVAVDSVAPDLCGRHIVTLTAQNAQGMR